MTAESVARALSGRKSGCGWTARCPAHDDRTPSLSIRDGANNKVLVRCHAGCEQKSVIAALRTLGLWAEKGKRSFRCPPPRSHEREPDQADAKRSEIALAIFNSAKSSRGTLVEKYLASRGMLLQSPKALRFHAGLKHPSGGVWPAMVALVTRGSDGTPLAVHRTFIANDGSGKAPVDPQRMIFGPCRGGAVRLADLGDMLMVGEGIETCLAAMQATGHPAWAALSTAGLRGINLPNEVRHVIVLADGDVQGAAAALDCARRLKREGRRVRIARPPQGSDFNDMLINRAPPIEEGE
jgi:putative DNA primase/helicase